MTRQLLIETLEVRAGAGGALFESGTGLPCYLKEEKNGKLILRFPATILDKKNENGRTYRTSVMENALRRKRDDILARKLLCTVNDHPKEPYPPPGEASHLITNAWCEKGHLYNEAEVLPTHNGQDLKALVDNDVSFGVSIRGLGSLDHQGNIQEDYDFLGTDCVGLPSAKLWVQPEKVTDQSGPRIESSNSLPAPQPIAVESSMNVNEIKKYVAEQTILLRSEKESDPVAAFQRAATVESELAKAQLAPQEAAGVYSEWDSVKKELFASQQAVSEGKEGEDISTYQERIAKLEEQLDIVSETYRKQIAKIAESAKSAISKLVKVSETSDRKYKAALNECVKLKEMYGVAINEAAKQQLKYDCAVDEAAQLVNTAYTEKQHKEVAQEAYKIAVGTAGSLVRDIQYMDRKIEESQEEVVAIQERQTARNRNPAGLFVERDAISSRVIPTRLEEKTAVKKVKEKQVRDHGVPGLL